MYLISQGSCAVSVYDHSKTKMALTDMHVRTLGVSDYFGEISLVYDGVRTATVTTTNYCTIGKLSGQILWEICSN
jgi:CRP-like cAMP-binding protein